MELSIQDEKFFTLTFCISLPTKILISANFQVMTNLQTIRQEFSIWVSPIKVCLLVNSERSKTLFYDDTIDI